jgi:hypothetical protein
VDVTLRLFHVSETPGIASFAPRPDGAVDARVWAIAESHLRNYLLPRDCPRVTFSDDSKAVVAIEAGWFERCLSTRLSVYEFDPGPFTLQDEPAAYYTASETVRPIGEETVPNPIRAILDRGVELRVLPSLWELREAVARSDLRFSIIRMRNASPPPAGFTSEFPVPQ